MYIYIYIYIYISIISPPSLSMACIVFITIRLCFCFGPLSSGGLSTCESETDHSANGEGMHQGIGVRGRVYP